MFTAAYRKRPSRSPLDIVASWSKAKVLRFMPGGRRVVCRIRADAACSTSTIDAVPEPDWLERLILRFAELPDDVAGIGGEMRPIWEDSRPNWLTDALLRPPPSVISSHRKTMIGSDLVPAVERAEAEILRIVRTIEPNASLDRLDPLILDRVLIGYAPSRPRRMKSAIELLNLLRKKNFFFGFAMLQSMPASPHAPVAWNRRKQSIATTREAGVWR